MIIEGIKTKVPEKQRMTASRRAVLNRIQSNFPLCPRPFQVIGKELALSEDEVIDIVTDLKKQGLVRRIGGNVVPGKIGYVSTLCAAKVPESRVDAFAEVVNQYTGVTHNYVRENEFNIWFTFIAPSREMIQSCLEEIRQKTGVQEILDLPATHVFKIRAKFDI